MKKNKNGKRVARKEPSWIVYDCIKCGKQVGFSPAVSPSEAYCNDCRETMEEKTENEAASDLLGKFFYSMKDDKIHWQGKITGKPEPGIYIVLLFSWLDGAPNVQKLIKIENMADWLFYDTAEDAKFDHDHGVASRLQGLFSVTPKDSDRVSG